MLYKGTNLRIAALGTFGSNTQQTFSVSENSYFIVCTYGNGTNATAVSGCTLIDRIVQAPLLEMNTHLFKANSTSVTVTSSTTTAIACRLI